MDPSSLDDPSGSWDSIHVFETAERGRQAHYKLTSTVMLQLVTRRTEDTQTHAGHAVAIQEKKPSDHGSKSFGEVNLSGSMTRQVICNNFGLLNSSFLTHRVFYDPDGAGLAPAGFFVAYHQYRTDDRGDGDQDA